MEKGSKKIPLSQGLFALVDDADFDFLNQWKWYAHSSKPGLFYAIRNRPKSEGRGIIHMHRLILGVTKGKFTDHVNHNGLDNRRQNLRICTAAENNQNLRMRSDNKSGFKGVSWHNAKKRWCAYVSHKFLGRFHEKEDAVRAVIEFKKENNWLSMI